MKYCFKRPVLIALSCLLMACGDDNKPGQSERQMAPAGRVQLPEKALPGGATTHVGRNPESPLGHEAFSHPAANLTGAQRGRFTLGNSFFTKPWVSAPSSTTARDGLGPLFNASACQDCHLRDGRGVAPHTADIPFTSALVRLSVIGRTPHPVYGGQLQTRAVLGVKPEANAAIDWQAETVVLPDGTTVSLRKPTLELSAWGYGEPGPLQTSIRIAQPMIGLGLLEAIAEDDIRANAATQQAPLSGRPNTVEIAGNTPTTGLGRFGWKAGQPTVRQQSLKAFANDIGITSGLVPADACTSQQPTCQNAPHGGSPELKPNIERAIVFYSSNLAPPARRNIDNPTVQAGEALFHQIGCAGCHTPSWTTGSNAPAHLAKQKIWPYTDMLLHDMGPGLADGVTEGDAIGAEWRTPPLWGLGHTKTLGGEHAGYLHDGRARTLIEAILWHGGEATSAKDAWAKLTVEQRQQVIQFLASL